MKNKILITLLLFSTTLFTAPKPRTSPRDNTDAAQELRVNTPTEINTIKSELNYIRTQRAMSQDNATCKGFAFTTFSIIVVAFAAYCSKTITIQK